MTIHVERKGTLLHIILAATVLLAIALAVFLTAITRATDISWTSSSDPTLTYETKTPPGLSGPSIFGCTAQKIAVDGLFPSIDACVTTGKSIKLATYRNPTNGSDNLAISYLSDKKFYKLSNANVSYSFSPVLMPGTDILYVMMPNGSMARSLSVFKPFPSKLSRTLSIIDHTEYMWDLDNPNFVLKDENGTKWNLNAVAHSAGGRWIVTEVRGGGLIRVDTDNLSAEVISRYYQSYGFGNDPIMSIAVTADGQHVAVGGRNARFVAIDVPDDCGDPATNATMTPDHTMPHPCPEKDYSVFIDSRAKFPNQFNWADNLEFSDNGGQLTFYYGTATERRFVTMTAAGYVPSPQLDYLALGDSYSSGEGDTEPDPATGNKYYRPWTDNEANQTVIQPREKCHVSTRSYPYKLALGMSLALDNPKQWDSVACSGASVVNIIPDDRDSDYGQNNRLLGFSNYADLKKQALNEMIPGRVKQIEFIKKYKPKVITLTMGGNDIGFPAKIADCATYPVTCDIVNDRRDELASLIHEQYDNLKTLYEQLYDASDSKAKIYVLGYPRFINGNSSAACGFNIALLNPSEREMIDNSLIYLNNVIESAAGAAGVQYIDIEDSLEGHRLCDDQEKYVTGVTNRFGLNGNEESESFHPNPKGHFEMAMSVWDNVNNESLIDYDTCPGSDENRCRKVTATKDSIEVPPYFQNSNLNKNVQHKEMTNFEQITGQVMDVTLGIYNVAANSVVTITGHSDPINLGQYITNEDGSLQASVPIPDNLSIGYHTLILQGQTYSGEPIEYEQTILVKNSDPNDIDGDGIVDNADKCFFVTPVNIDFDSDGIDDACDPEIGEPKEAYRIRGGIVASSEQANYLYIERNVNATTLTGISGDYDPDHDGWAVVAASQNTTQAGPYARFWIDGNDGSKIPHVSLRTAENGCVQYKPANLTKVIDSSPRTFVQEATDTNTCRSEPATADLDNDGNPDNTQPLYRARNGITANGEDSRKLYLERSTRGAEAQLGKSDYAGSATPPTGPTDTVDHRKVWSLLATSSPGLIVDTYKKLVFINNQPYVLAANFLNQCYAYKSQSLATIKQSTQATRQLQIDWVQTLNVQLQGGCNG